MSKPRMSKSSTELKSGALRSVVVWGVGPMVLSILVGTYSLAVSAKTTMPTELSETLQHYRDADSMILEVKKTVKNTALDKESLFKGMIRFVKGKFYWETNEPEKSLIVYNGKTLWTVQYPGSEFEGAAVQVAKTTIRDKKNSPIILSEVFGSRPLNTLFDVKQISKDGALIFYKLTEKKNEFGLKDLMLKIDTKEQRIASLEYTDEVENETKIDFRATQFNVKVRKSIFDYKPPKNAQMTEY